MTFDSTGRATSDTDGTIRTGSQEWDAPDRLLASTDAAGRKSTTIYDAAGRVTDTYGPAPASCFGTDRRPTASCPEVPHVHTDFDQGIRSLAAAYWPNTTMTGPVKVHDTGVGEPTGAIYRDWGTGGPDGLGVVDGWSARYTGEISFPATGTFTLSAYSDDGVRLYVGDQVVFDNFTAHAPAWTSGTYTAPSAGWQRIRLEHFDQGGGARLELHWTGPGGASGVVPGASLSPRYGLVTTSVVADSSGVPAEVTAQQYSAPHLGLATTSIVDPGGLALASTTSYELPGSGFLRRTARTLPAGAGSTNTYEYYGATEAADDPCTAPAETHPQGGMLKKSTAADPDGTGPQQPIVREQRHDSAGRVVATRMGTEPWTCTTYDTRGRPTSIVYPAFGGAPARTVAMSHAVGGNPLVTSVSDSAGTITTTVDLLGRVVGYSDVHGKTTTTVYDGLGRVAQTQGPAGSLAYTYDPAGRVETVRLDGLVVADPVYDTAGELASVSYPDGAGNAGNGTALGSIGRDAAGRTTALTWALTGATVTDAVIRSRSGKIIDQSIDGVDAYPAGANFAYDGAGRLVSARVPGRAFSYGFAPSGGCGVAATAGKNTNRTSLVVDGGTPVTYCYDHADRLTSTSQSGYTGAISYDAHGNTTLIAGETRGYDAADRHLSTTTGAVTVAYTRDALDRIVARTDSTGTVKYAYSASGDTGDATLDGAGNVIEATIPLPGGVLLTRRASTQVWSYPNIHGDVIASADTTGTKQGQTLHWGPNGETLTTTPDNSTGAFDHGWLGQHQRPTEHQAGLTPTIEMGARQYDPTLGRFLQIDPVEGGNDNDYTYVQDPVNMYDLDGRCGLGNPFKKCGKGHKGRCLLGTHGGRGGSCRGGSVSKPVQRWANRNRWKIAGVGVAATCIASAGWGCGLATTSLFAAQARSAHRAGAGWRTHVRNLITTYAYAVPGFGLTGAYNTAAWRALGEVPGLTCNAFDRCAGP